jgi:hypothetical protein
MAFLVLGLSCLPCADEGFTINTDKAKIESVKQQNQQEDQHHSDACSPFCHCTCCAGFSINHSSTAVTSLIIFDSKSFTPYLSVNITEISIPVWQPPQL